MLGSFCQLQLCSEQAINSFHHSKECDCVHMCNLFWYQSSADKLGSYLIHGTAEDWLARNCTWRLCVCIIGGVQLEKLESCDLLLVTSANSIQQTNQNNGLGYV